MKTANLRPLLRAFHPFLIAIAVLWAMPKNANAQLYVMELPPDFQSGSVSEYDASTGATIRGRFITGVDGYQLQGLALSGNTLFVADATGHGDGSAVTYGTTTGDVRLNFISLRDGVNALATDSGIVFAAEFNGLSAYGFVTEYDATTGSTILEFRLESVENSNGITGLAAYGGYIFVAQFFDVSEYDSSGREVGPNFIPGPVNPSGLAVSDNTLFVADFDNGTVGKYNADTGDPINANFIMGLSGPSALAVSRDAVFVAQSNGTVGKYNTTTGVAIKAKFITGLNHPAGLAIK